MRKDPTEFRERFAKWKAGELVYEAGLPKYGGGKGNIDFYDDVTKHIILKEGFLTAPKDIGDGKITIGSGLTQKKYIDQYKRNGNKWSLKENYIAVKDTARGFENSLRGILPEYDQYPAEMRKALIDIIYNIGEGGLKNSPKFLSAMKSRNWNEAKRLMDWDNSDPLFGNGARKRNAERAALFDAGLARWSPTGPVELMMENKPVFVPQPVFVPLTKNNTDYSIETMTSPTIPLMLNSRNSGDSPLYGGSDYSFRLPSIKEVVERLLFLGLPKYGGGKSEEDAFYERMLQRQAQLNSPTVLYTRANGNPVAFDTEGNLVDLVTGQKGTMMIPEVNVTAMHPRNYRSSYNPDVIRDFTDWVPIVSDVGLGLDAYTAFKNKDYTQAGILGGALLLPNIIENSGKYIYKGLRKLGVPQYFSKEMLQNREALWKRFKNLDIFDSLRGIKYVDDVYHGSKNTFDINHARAYAPAGMDTGFHMGSSPTPAYSRANGLLGGALYSGKLKLKEAPFELDDLNRWGWREIIAETDNNPKFKKYLEDKGIDLDRLLNTALDLEKEYDNLDSFGQQAYLKEHGGFESDKYMAKLFKDKNVSFKYKNKFETFDGVPEYSYAIYNPDNVVWNRPFLFNERKLDLEKLYDIGMAGKYSWNDPDKITILLEDLYRVLKDFPLYRLPGFKNGKTLKYENRRVPSIKDLQIPTFR